MQVLLSLLGNKIFLWAIIAVGIFGTFQMRSCQEAKYNEKIATYERQLSGQLTDKERELQKMHKEMGVAQSELMTRDELIKRLEKDKEEVDASFEAFKKEHNLQIRSRDRTIASLEQKLKGGNSSTEVVAISPNDEGCKGIESRCIISYNWEDNLKRFKLTDPNIFERGNELFESAQVFKIYGEVYEQKDGSLQTRRLVLREVYQNEQGEYIPIPDAKADIIDSQFEYHNPPTIETEFSWLDLFRLRAIALGTVAAFPDSGALKLGLGVEFFQFKGFGINTHTALDFKDVEKWEQRIGAAYMPTILDQELNLGLGLSVGTPFAKFGQQWSLNIDLIFYLHD
jgi:hypothetical protein